MPASCRGACTAVSIRDIRGCEPEEALLWLLLLWLLLPLANMLLPLLLLLNMLLLLLLLPLMDMLLLLLFALLWLAKKTSLLLRMFN
jgi:hypothetical protein